MRKIKKELKIKDAILGIIFFLFTFCYLALNILFNEFDR